LRSPSPYTLDSFFSHSIVGGVPFSALSVADDWAVRTLRSRLGRYGDWHEDLMLIARNRQGGRKQGQSSIRNFEVCPGINGLYVSQGWLEYLGAKEMRVVLICPG